MKNEINVTSLVSLLAAQDSSALKNLQNRYPTVKALQPGLKVLGTEKDVSLDAFHDLVAETLRVSHTRMVEIGRHLDKRLRWARRIRLGGSLVGGLASAGLVGAVLLEQRIATIITAIVSFVSSSFAVVADFIENGATSNPAGLAAMRLRAATAISQIATLDGEAKLLSALNASSDERIPVIQRANALAADVRQIEFEAGLLAAAQ
ncbi:MAG: hypothetical protein HYX38_10485 [Rhodospirillales bacterium]|nr:hypothetical protein [Rhodospirillales bacterium]